MWSSPLSGCMKPCVRSCAALTPVWANAGVATAPMASIATIASNLCIDLLPDETMSAPVLSKSSGSCSPTSISTMLDHGDHQWPVVLGDKSRRGARRSPCRRAPAQQAVELQVSRVEDRFDRRDDAAERMTLNEVRGLKCKRATG